MTRVALADHRPARLAPRFGDTAVEVMLAAGLEPLEPYLRASAPWLCRCLHCGAEVRPQFNNVRSGQRGCKPCGMGRYAAARRARKAEAAVETMRAAGLEPLTPYPGTGSPWPSKCLTCGSDVAPHLSSIENGGGCRVCNLGKGGAMLRSRNVDAAAELMRQAGWAPLEEYPGSGTPWLSRHACGKVHRPTLNTVRRSTATGDGQGCPRCSRVERISSLAAEAELTAAGFEPLAPYPGNTRTAWPARCLSCGTESAPWLTSIRSGRSCIGCGQLRAKTAQKARQGPIAEQVMRGAGLDPLEPYPGTHTPWRCRCTRCGTEVSPRWHNVQQGQGGCSQCALPGIGPADPAYLYLLWNPAKHSTKVGIGKIGANRLEQHARQGWQPFAVWTPMTGAQAYRAESAALALWRACGLAGHLTPDEMPQAGWTETACLSPAWIQVTVDCIELHLDAMRWRGGRQDGSALAPVMAWKPSGGEQGFSRR